MVQHIDYLGRIARWLPYARHYFHVPPDRSDLLCYGTGYDGWGVQTNQKAFSAFAVVAALNHDERAAKEALRLFRFCLETHIEGSYTCTDGRSWGHTWISALGTERMMHALEAIRGSLTEEDEKLLQRVLISEAEWLLNEYEVVAGLENSSRRNKPESNLWNGGMLYRTALLYPEHPSAGAFRNKAIDFFMNSISIPSDEKSDAMYDGERVGAHFKGANFFPSFALNHHGYLNVGYMVICLSQIAMLDIWCKERGFPVPESLHLHAKELWQLVKTLTFPDGRLNRIGGDTRARYCYCQDYLIPTWLYALDTYGDTDVLEMERQWLTIVGQEQDHNQTGGFISDRGRELRKASQLYYTRLDSDRACSLSMGAWWRRSGGQFSSVLTGSKHGAVQTSEIRRLGSWHDEYHGSFYHEDRGVTCAFTWEGAEGPTAQYLPSQASDLAEWRHNLTVHVRGEGAVQTSCVLNKHAGLFDGGAIASGTYEIRESIYIAEGEADDKPVAAVSLLFALLPDSRTAIVIQRAVSPLRTAVDEVRGLFFQVPNDIWNSCSRSYSWSSGSRSLAGYGAKTEALTVASDWIEIDGKVRIDRIYGTEVFTIFRPGRRQIGFKRYSQRPFLQKQGMLYCDEICCEFVGEKRMLDRGEVIVDSAHVLSVPPAAPLRALTVRSESEAASAVRAVEVLTQEHGRYLAVLPLQSDEPIVLYLPDDVHGSARDVLTEETVPITGGRLELGRQANGRILTVEAD